MNENKNNISGSEGKLKSWCMEMTKPSNKLVCLISITIILSVGFNILLTLALTVACLIFSKKLENGENDSEVISKISNHLRCVGILTFKFLSISTAVLFFIISIEYSKNVPKYLMEVGMIFQFFITTAFLCFSIINIIRLNLPHKSPISDFSVVITAPIRGTHLFFLALTNKKKS